MNTLYQTATCIVCGSTITTEDNVIGHAHCNKCGHSTYLGTWDYKPREVEVIDEEPGKSNPIGCAVLATLFVAYCFARGMGWI